MISPNAFTAGASILGCGERELKTVCKVEGGGMGLEPETGRPIILFEPHVFYRQLKHNTPIVADDIAGQYPDICYPKWGTRPYPYVPHNLKATQDLRYAQLEKAAAIHHDSAYMAASWGLFQVLGENWAETGCKTLKEFIDKNYQSEDTQLWLAVNVMKRRGMGEWLKARAWVKVAQIWNGDGQKEHYATELLNAFTALK